MHVIVKQLKGGECRVSVAQNSFVEELKQQVENLMSVPVIQQKLVFKGKTLSDEKTLGYYGIEDGGKIFLMLKHGDSSNAMSPQESANWLLFKTFLLRHFTEKNSDLVLKELKKEVERGVSALSLNDIERLAAVHLKRQQPT